MYVKIVWGCSVGFKLRLLDFKEDIVEKGVGCEQFGVLVFFFVLVGEVQFIFVLDFEIVYKIFIYLFRKCLLNIYYMFDFMEVDVEGDNG